MNKYKAVFWILRSISIIILLGTILLLVIPIGMNLLKPDSNLKVNVLIKDNAKYEWLMKHEKIKESNFSDAQLVFADEQILDTKYLENVKHKTIVMENLFTDLNEKATKTKQLSDFVGVSYSGYSGKTFLDLADKKEVPQKLIEQYEKNTGKIWSFYGEGIIIYSLENIVVLQRGSDYEGSLSLVTDTENIPYTGDFEITSGSSLTKQTAAFHISLNAKGKSNLDQYNLKSDFPAAYAMSSPLYNIYYYTGNFGTDISMLTVAYEFMPEIMKNKVLYDSRNGERAYWKWYYPSVVNVLVGAENNKSDFSGELTSADKFYVVDKSIYIKDNAEGKEFFIKGVNLGAALPGKAFTEFPLDKSVYTGWLNEMAEMNVNTVRIYTLFPPAFYEALYEFNEGRAEPIYLLQEIWPEENPANLNYLDAEYNNVYQTEIQNVVDAIHGNGNIPERSTRAYGLYRFDVSKYLLAYLVGREMEPAEVLATDTLNKGYKYNGTYVYSGENASPTESWLAESCDFALQLEATYHNMPLVGIVSWPTLDALTHDSEWNSSGNKLLQYNDSAVVDINHIDVNSQKISGFFGAYHIYPNYPDFMNNDTEYAKYTDEQGVFRYGGYLQAFMEQNTKYPAVVAEYGISTSMYTAHYNPDSYNHGGLNEVEQGNGIIRMTKAIKKEGYAGAIIFEWMDEWAKKTWTTEPYIIPFNRNVFWHNAMDPEQNYGIIAYKTNENILNELTTVYQNEGSNQIKTIQVGQDESYIYLSFDFAAKLSADQKFSVLLSTASEKSGSDYWEFLINYGQNPQILVNPAYNWLNGYFMAKNNDFSKYEQLIQLTNRENTSKDGSYVPNMYQNLSDLSIGSFNISKNQISLDQNHVIFRIPYGLIGISDPSSDTILSDEKVLIPTGQDAVKTKKITQIKYEFDYEGKRYTFVQKLKSWNTPTVTAVRKESFQMISDFFRQLK